MMAATTSDGIPGRNGAPVREDRSAAAREAPPLKKLQPILVPLDGSDLAERALPYAEALSGPGCQLILLEVGQDEEEFHLLDRHEGACAQLETAVGDPAEQILQVADQLSVGLIVMTTHGRGAIGRWAFGSVADQVSRTSPVPVMVIRPGEGDTDPAPVIRRVLVPLDGSPLSRQALPTAEATAQQVSAPVHLVRAIDVSRLLPVELMPTVAFNAEIYENAVDEAQREARESLTEAAEELRRAGVVVTQEVQVGSPFTVIQEALHPGDVIVLVSRGHHGAARLVLGSLAEQLIREATAPVVLVPGVAPQTAQV